MHGPFLAVSALLLAISTVIPIRGQASGSGKTDAPTALSSRSMPTFPMSTRTLA